MSSKNFYTGLLVTTLIAVGCNYAFTLSPKIQAYVDIGWISIVVFLVLSVVLYYLSVQSARSENKKRLHSACHGGSNGKVSTVCCISAWIPTFVSTYKQMVFSPCFFSVFNVHHI